MRYTICILLSTLFIACGSYDERPNTNIDPELGGYITAFVGILSSNSISIPRSNVAALRRVSFAPTRTEEDADTVGVCITYEDKLTYRDIEIDPGYWQAANQNRAQLMFHELGHCLLDLAHSDDEQSIMFPNILTRSVYQVYDALLFAARAK